MGLKQLLDALIRAGIDPRKMPNMVRSGKVPIRTTEAVSGPEVQAANPELAKAMSNDMNRFGKGLLGLNYDPELLANINRKIGERSQYGYRREPGAPGYVLHWANSSADWLPETVGKAPGLSDLRPDYIEWLRRMAAENPESYEAKLLEAISRDQRLLDANQVYIGRGEVPRADMLRAVTPWADQLPLYSGGPLGGSFENKMRRLKRDQNLGEGL